ncbi:MAG: DUF2062 domain-containing protein [Desulfomonilaceae bacterium]|nr:DUF2062 domain-containing protein [Desulfomonilaceae bacterium]
MTEERPESLEKAAPKSGESPRNQGDGSAEIKRSYWSDLIRKRLLEPLAVSDNPPWVDALGVALGLFVALGIPVGGHLLTLGIVRTFLRYNIVVAFAFTWIINPFTVLPLYYGYYYVGSLILGGESIMGSSGFHQAMEPIVHSRNFLDALRQFVLLDLMILKSWAITAILVSIPAGVLGYAIAYRVQSRRRASAGEASGR